MTGNIQPEKKSVTSKPAKSIERAVFSKWSTFNYFALFCFLVVPPLLYPFGPLITLVIFLILFIFPILSDRVKLAVADRNPTIFLKVEKIKRGFQRAFWLLVLFPSLILSTIFLFVPTQYLNEMLSKYEPEFIILMLFFFGYYFYSISMIGNIRQQPRMLRATARASFLVLSKSLGKSDSKQRGTLRRAVLIFFGMRVPYEKQWRQIGLFENGLDSLNGFLTNRFDIELCNPSKYKDYFRFVIWTQDNVEADRIGKVLEKLECSLRSTLNLANVLSTVKKLLMEKQSFSKEELLQELDFKTGLRRWYNHNKEILKIVFPVASLIVSVLAFVTRFL